MRSKPFVFAAVLLLACRGPLLAQDLGSGDPLAVDRDAEALRDAERERRLAFFRAISMDDEVTVRQMLAEGIDPNGDLIPPVSKEFVEGFEDARLRYFVSSERGFTPLMLATALGNEILVRELLSGGASPGLKTKRHKTFALWLAGKYEHLEIMRMLT